MISVSLSRGENRFIRDRNNHFEEINHWPTINEFCGILTTRAWSPITWIEKTRYKTSRFKHCAYLALDFDEGFTLDACDKWLTENDLIAIVAASKSHQRDKITESGTVLPPCDRFRVVIPFNETVTDGVAYKGMMREIMHREPTSATDQSCKDDKRFFFPCREILKVYRGTKRFPVLKPGIDFQDQKVLAKKSVEKHALYREHKVMGQREMILLERGYDEQGRGNPTILSLSRSLTLQGFAEDEIRNELIQAGFDRATAWERALERGIEYGHEAFRAAEQTGAGDAAYGQGGEQGQG